MISLNEAPAAETDPLYMTLFALFERIADPAGNADRALRLDATIAEALDLIERLTTVLKAIDMESLTRAVGLGRELVAVQGELQLLRNETRDRAEATTKLKIEVTRRLENLKELGKTN
jgi:hypothetical protein